MIVKQMFVSTSKDGFVFYAVITGKPDQKSPTWTLEIYKQLNEGGYNMVYSGSFSGLWHAKRAMEKWRKGLKWTLRR